jgi:hypothetical protein
MNTNNNADDLLILTGGTPSSLAGTETAPPPNIDYSLMMDGTASFRQVFSDAAESPYSVPSPERTLVMDVAATLEKALSPDHLQNVTSDELLGLAKRLKENRLAFYIAKGMVFTVLRERYTRERDFLAYVKSHTVTEDHLEARSIQVYMRVCRIFWLELTPEMKERFARYYNNVSLSRLELLAREEHRGKWFHGECSIILQECQGANKRIEEFPSVAELEKALQPLHVPGTGEASPRETETPPQEPEEEPGEAPNLVPLSPSTYVRPEDDADIRVEGFNITQTEDGDIHALPGARLALWMECVPLPDRESRRRLHVYDGDLEQWHEIALDDYEIG